MKRSLFISVIFLSLLCLVFTSCSGGGTPKKPDIYSELSELFPEEGYAEGVKPAELPSALIPAGYEAVHSSFDREGRIFALLVSKDSSASVLAVLAQGNKLLEQYDIPGEASRDWRVIHCDGGYTVIQDVGLGKLHVLDEELFNVYDVDMWSRHIESLVYNASLDMFFFSPESSAAIILTDTDFTEEEEVYAFEYPFSAPLFLSYSSDYKSIVISVVAGESDVHNYCSFSLDEYSASFEGISDR